MYREGFKRTEPKALYEVYRGFCRAPSLLGGLFFRSLLFFVGLYIFFDLLSKLFLEQAFDLFFDDLFYFFLFHFLPLVFGL